MKIEQCSAVIAQSDLDDGILLLLDLIVGDRDVGVFASQQ
jgi:hypothetical protein